MPIDLSFGDVGDGFEPVDDGIYTLRVISAEVKQNKEKTGQIIEMVYEIIDEGQYKKRQLRDWPSLSVAARWRIRDILEAITQQPWREDNMQLELKDLYGRTVKAIVIRKPKYNDPNTIVNSIDKYLPDTAENANVGPSNYQSL